MKTAIEEARDRLRIAYKYYPASFREGFIDCLQIFERHYATPAQQYAKELKSPMPQNEINNEEKVETVIVKSATISAKINGVMELLDWHYPDSRTSDFIIMYRRK